MSSVLVVEKGTEISTLANNKLKRILKENGKKVSGNHDELATRVQTLMAVKYPAAEGENDPLFLAFKPVETTNLRGGGNDICDGTVSKITGQLTHAPAPHLPINTPPPQANRIPSSSPPPPSLPTHLNLPSTQALSLKNNPTLPHAKEAVPRTSPLKHSLHELTQKGLVGPGKWHAYHVMLASSSQAWQRGRSVDASDLILEVQKKVKGDCESCFVSLTLDVSWAVWFACRKIKENQVTRAVIIEVDLRQLCEPIVDVSNLDGGSLNGLSGELLASAVSASELLVCDVNNDAITGRQWLVDPRTTAGETAMKIKGGDECVDASGSLVLGCYSRWLHDSGGYHELFFTKAKETKFLKSLEMDGGRKSRDMQVTGKRKRQRSTKYDD